jgi:hypothetical protein
MKIDLDEITCPVCGISHDDHVERLTLRELVFDEGICNECDNWAEQVHDDILNGGLYPDDAIPLDVACVQTAEERFISDYIGESIEDLSRF